MRIVVYWLSIKVIKREIKALPIVTMIVKSFQMISMQATISKTLLNILKPYQRRGSKIIRSILPGTELIPSLIFYSLEQIYIPKYWILIFDHSLIHCGSGYLAKNIRLFFSIRSNLNKDNKKEFPINTTYYIDEIHRNDNKIEVYSGEVYFL